MKNRSKISYFVKNEVESKKMWLKIHKCIRQKMFVRVLFVSLQTKSKVQFLSLLVSMYILTVNMCILTYVSELIGLIIKS